MVFQPRRLFARHSIPHNHAAIVTATRQPQTIRAYADAPHATLTFKQPSVCRVTQVKQPHAERRRRRKARFIRRENHLAYRAIPQPRYLCKLTNVLHCDRFVSRLRLRKIQG